MKVMVPMDPEYALAATAADYPVRFYDSLDAIVMGCCPAKSFPSISIPAWRNTSAPRTKIW